MSVTFFSNCNSKRVFVDEACLCAQMAPGFMRASPEVLREYASPTCSSCDGRGIESVPYDDGPSLNLNIMNARALLTALGFGYEDYRCGIPEARRAVIRARNVSLEVLTRAAVRIMAVVGDEIVPRVYSPAFTEEDLRERIDRFADFVEASAERGASLILWG